MLGIDQTFTGKIIGACICVLGLIGGIVWATKRYKSKKGTIWFMSRTMASPELDKNKEELK